jgi:hypothetical protein
LRKRITTIGQAPVFAPFIMVIATVLAFFAGCV